ncbi:hypothetical protein [Dyadobacter frigoris]|uniref:Uncharacterized protein n=1 Tax=Dyadobacter frigoris TaxID=2576211 RepID=A0A4U6D4N3_9BACT|nr:hypothetical protein [Dyadobacter frigoris]TKT92279.1 hypothetical protein FDK13_09880 [Dyadobacter frigoris]GLU53460.1 hypothetical protein Dfri01_29210 [Dyadobacter frigoris]
MSSERFDKLIKKNLESVRPEYQPPAWDRFSKKLPAVGFFPWVQQYGGWALAAMMLAGWFTTLYTLRENQELIRQLSNQPGRNMAYENNAGRGSVQTDQVTKTNKSVALTDTVYIVKKTIIEHRHFYDSPPDGRNRFAENGKDPDRKISTNTPVFTSDSNSEINDIHEEKETLLTKTSEAENHREADKNTFLEKGSIAHNTESGTNTEADTTEKVTDEDRFNMLLDSNRVIQAYNYKVLAALVDSLSAKKTAAPVIKPKRPPFKLSSLQPRLGMESLLSLHSYGIGPVVEFFPAENLGISLGIQASTLEAENHKALRDYNSATGKFFLVQYRSYLPSKFDRIEDISIKTSVVSLPISLKYYIPLKKNISIFVQSGTSLDLSAYQQVDFESYLNNSKRRNTFETDAKPNFFHNLMFGAGVQYKKSRILAQLSPFYVYDFRNIVNTPSGSNLGLRASLWLNLFK